MRIDLTTFMFNMDLSVEGGDPSWSTAIAFQNAEKKYKPDGKDIVVGMFYKKIKDVENVWCPIGKGGNQQSNHEFTIASLFDKVFVNGKHVVDGKYVLLLTTQLVASPTAQQHVGRKLLRYNPKITYNGVEYNEDCRKKIISTLGLNDDSAWFVSDINVINQDELHLRVLVADKDHSLSFGSTQERKDYCGNLAGDANAKGGYNKIYYGAPGCGKSYFIENEVLQNVAKENRFRTTFHPDYSNSDFVGQVMPYVENVDDPNNPGKVIEKVSYKFAPGPFALALKRCYETDKMVHLVIEELNRGNASAIFGDLFQLLDRIDDASDPNFGRSRYSIIITSLQKYLTDELGMEFDSIIIPSNLTILATMNSSDQNVFTLDTAFKRRWGFEQMPNKFDDNHKYKNWKVPGTPITWQKFVEVINGRILTIKVNNSTSEDKRLGKYFVSKECLTENHEDIKLCETKANAFAYKVLEYLWNDVCKLNTDELFVHGPRTLEELIEEYHKSTLNIFVNPDEFYTA